MLGAAKERTTVPRGAAGLAWGFGSHICLTHCLTIWRHPVPKAPRGPAGPVTHPKLSTLCPLGVASILYTDKAHSSM